MKIGNLLVNAAYLGSKVLTAIAVGATKVWEGVSKYIKFADPVVEQICMKWSSDGVGLTREDVAKVTNIGTTFILNKEIVSFDELRFFNLSIVADQAFQQCENLQSVIIPSSATSIGNYAFLNNSSLHSVEIPKDSKLTSIGSQSFSGCAKIKSLYIPPSVVSLGTNAFYNCAKLEYLDIPKTLTSIPNNLLLGCNSLNNITIPADVTSIGQYAFCNCKKFTLVDIPDKVTSIGAYAFLGCSSIQSFVCRPLQPPTLESNSLTGTSSTMVIYVPDVEAYKGATNWSAHADKIKPISEYQPTNNE